MVDDPPRSAVSKLPLPFCLNGPQLWARVDPCDNVTLPPPCPGLRSEGESASPAAALPLPISHQPWSLLGLRPKMLTVRYETRPNILPSSTCLAVVHSRGHLTHHELPTSTVHVLMWCVCRSLGTRRTCSIISSSDLLVCTSLLCNMAFSRLLEAACDSPKTSYCTCIFFRH